ncbi:alpha/beta fold hydrolase [Streptomyces sp. NPDC058155]|uniref:alpha/beta fold hydrolase n=1 Tax=Streptomyces sp. NPDC058155 TaxID=3346359 RepID=UPI0036E6CFEC
MTVVFVHGVPETPTIWNDVRERIGQPSMALRLPGFGSPRPAGLRDKETYAAWLADELRAVDGPVDIVGHDWGGHLAMRVVSAYDVPVRSWVSDVAHGWHPDYQWHEAATLWQRSPEGEESLAGLRKSPTGGGYTFGDVLQPRGMSPQLAKEVDDIHDEEMSAAILALYRSAWPNFHAAWGRDFDRPVTARGLILTPAGDPGAQPARDRDMAARLRTQLTELDGLTHYWMLQDPERGADALRHFWASLPD